MLANSYIINGLSEDITIGIASATHTTNFPAGTTHARLVGTTNCRVRRSAAGGSAAVATDMLLVTGVEYFIPVYPGDKVTAIQDSAGGKLNVLPISAF